VGAGAGDGASAGAGAAAGVAASGFGGGVSGSAALSHPHNPIVASKTNTQPLRPNAMRKNSLQLLNG